MSVANILKPSSNPLPAEVKSIQITTGASVGAVLTSDASGNGTWQAGASSSKISFNVNVNYNSTAIPVTIVFVKTGLQVTCIFPGAEIPQSGGASYALTDDFTLPSGYIPSTAYNGGISSGEIYYPYQIADDGPNVNGTANLSYESSPTALINFTNGGTDFSGTGLLVLFAGSFTYATDT